MDSRKLTGAVLTLLMIYAVISFTRAQTELISSKELTQSLTEKLISIERENEELAKKTAALCDDETLAALAHTRLGLVFPDEIIFVD